MGGKQDLSVQVQTSHCVTLEKNLLCFLAGCLFNNSVPADWGTGVVLTG